MRCPYCGIENPDGTWYCNNCGQQIVFPSPYNQYQPIVKPKDDSKVLLIIIIVVLLIIIVPVILAGALYLWVLGIDNGPRPPWEILIDLNKSETGNGIYWEITVISVHGVAYESEIDVVIVSNGTLQLFERLSSFNPEISMNGVTYFETSADATLDAGDYFLLDRVTYPEGTIFDLIAYNYDSIVGRIIL